MVSASICGSSASGAKGNGGSENAIINNFKVSEDMVQYLG
jgi:hypothetical protein